jgi:hypothetical protein
MGYTVTLAGGVTVTAESAREMAELVAILGVAVAAPALPPTPRIEAPPPQIASDAAPTPQERPEDVSRPPRKPGRKMDSGKGGVYPTGSGTFRFKVHVGGRQVCGPSRATREEAEADLVAVKVPAQAAAAQALEGSEPTSLMDPIARAPRRGPHEADRIGPKSSLVARVVHSFDAPTTGEGFARCGERGDSVIVTGKTSAVNCVECLRLMVEDKITGLARAADAPAAPADVVEREETRLRNLAELGEMARHIPSLPPRLRGMAEEQLAGKRTVEIAADRRITVQSVHQAMSQARRQLRRAAYVAGDRPSVDNPRGGSATPATADLAGLADLTPARQVPPAAPAAEPQRSSFSASDEVPKEEVTPARAVKSQGFPAAAPALDEDLSLYEAALLPDPPPIVPAWQEDPPGVGDVDRPEAPAGHWRKSAAFRERVAAGMRARWALRRAARDTSSNEPEKQERPPADVVAEPSPATCATAPAAKEANVDQDPDDAAPPLRKAQHRCSRCGIPGHRATTCDLQPLTRDERLMAIEAWATRRRAPPPIPAPPTTPAPPPMICRSFDTDEDFSEFLPDEITESPEPAGAVGTRLPPTHAPALPVPADHPDVPIERVRSKSIPIPWHGGLRRDELTAAEPYPDNIDRPRSREECRTGERPCPFVSCSHHLYLDVNDETGTIKLNFPHLEVWEMAETCSLDVADKGGITLEEVGAILNLTRERIRQVEVRGLRRIKDSASEELGLPPERESNEPI